MREICLLHLAAYVHPGDLTQRHAYCQECSDSLVLQKAFLACWINSLVLELGLAASDTVLWALTDACCSWWSLSVLNSPENWVSWVACLFVAREVIELVVLELGLAASHTVSSGVTGLTNQDLGLQLWIAFWFVAGWIKVAVLREFKSAACLAVSSGVASVSEDVTFFAAWICTGQVHLVKVVLDLAALCALFVLNAVLAIQRENLNISGPAYMRLDQG